MENRKLHLLVTTVAALLPMSVLHAAPADQASAEKLFTLKVLPLLKSNALPAMARTRRRSRAT